MVFNPTISKLFGLTIRPSKHKKARKHRQIARQRKRWAKKQSIKRYNY